MKTPPNAKLRHRVIAILSLLAMLVAPLCASVCAAGGCGHSLTQNGDCHDSLAANEGRWQIVIASVHTCPLQPTAALSENKISPYRLTLSSVMHPAANFVEFRPIQLAVIPQFLHHYREDSPGSSSSPDVLRI
jgi:hypothetical protein